MQTTITERDRKLLHQHLSILPLTNKYPRWYRKALLDQVVSYLCSQLEAGNPAYSDLAKLLKRP